MSSVHAEDNVIRKLPSMRTAKRTRKVDMLVIRVNRNGELTSSKPCLHCLVLMYTRLPAKGYNLCDIYFSNASGGLEVSRLPFLLFEDDPHVSRYHKDRGMTDDMREEYVAKINRRSV